MASYVVGDIHGRRDLLDRLLRRFQPSADDHVAFLGDYIDRGPDSRGVIELLLHYRESSKARVSFVCGNHEHSMLRSLEDHTRHTWLVGMQGFSTIRSYSQAAAVEIEKAMEKVGPDLFVEKHELPYQAFISAMPASHRKFFDELDYFVRTEDGVCVHGGVSETYTAVEDESESLLVWGRKDWWTDYSGPDTIAYGHWGNAVVTDSGARPFIHGRTIGVDAVGSGHLLAVRLPDGEYWSVDE